MSIQKKFEVPNLGEIGDIHDIHFLGRLLWISNTEFDEGVAYDPDKKEVIRRVSLDEFRVKLDDIQDEEKFEKVTDRFHCNQVFQDYNGDLCVLIHTLNGWLFYRLLLEKFVKKQGDGGIINLDKKEVIPLKLQSPHSICKNRW